MDAELPVKAFSKLCDPGGGPPLVRVFMSVITFFCHVSIRRDNGSAKATIQIMLNYPLGI